MKSILNGLRTLDKKTDMASVDELLEASRKVIQDCSLENGAIVAANSDKEYYPENVANYRFIWPRDAGFVIYAANILDMDVEEDFLDWLMERAEGFKESGIVFHRYSTNGPRDTDFGHQYQPDQAAALLWSILETNNELTDKQDRIIHLLADGLWKQWSGKTFHSPTHDLWEERQAYPDMSENFSYTLAACSEALYLAANRFNEEKWYHAAEEMRKALETAEAEKNGKRYFPRSSGEVSDKTVDASVLGLVWPFNVIKDDERVINSLNLVEEELLTEKGVMRYPGDMYDGMVHHTKHLKKGAGAWPLLTFWHVIALNRLGRTEDAERLFEKQLEQLKDEYIPEQVFGQKNKSSIKPLAWSHAMFVIAAHELGKIEQ